MPQYANVSQVPLSLAVFLAADNYDYDNTPNTISATTLLKPLRQVILGARVPMEDASVDLISMVSNRMGSAIHDGIENAWKKNYLKAMEALGIPKRVRESVIINPEPGSDLTDKIPVYLENRVSRQCGKWTVTGKPDFIGDGRVEDYKTTSVWSAILSSKDTDYILQGSIYRWIQPEIITKDEIAIQWLFTDWSAAAARQDPKYPQNRHMQRLFPLMTLNETDAFIRRKIALIEEYMDAPEREIPHCTDEDLWRSEPQFKYYKNPEKTTRSTKNFPTKQEAMLRYVEDGAVGLIKEVPGQVKACRYCPGFSLCSQKDLLIESGDLVFE